MREMLQPRKRIPFDRILSRSYWTWRANPALSVATMFSSGLTTLSQSVLGIFAIALLIRLEGTSYLATIGRDLSTETDAGLGGLLTSHTFLALALEYLLPGAVATVVVLVLASGFVYAAEYGSYWQAQAGEHVGVPEVMKNFVKRWRAMAWTIFLSYLLSLSPLLLAGAVAATVVIAVGTTMTALILAFTAVAAGSFGFLILSLLFVYTPVVVVSEGLSGLTAIRRSSGEVRKNVGTAFTYSVVYIFLIAGISYLTAVVPVANLPLSSLASVGILILVTPVLHLTKTELYSESQKPEEVGFETYKPFLSDAVGPLLRDLWKDFVRGLRELWDYVSDAGNAMYHALSAFALAAGWLLGIWVGNQGLTQVLYALGYVPGKINPLVTGSAPFTVGFYVFFHNWEVSLATALSGIWFSAAPFVTLALNGFLVGLLSDVVPNATMFAAAILPHGIIELPSFVIAGSAGMKLGVAFYRSVRRPGPDTSQRLDAIARQTIYIVIGLALLFFIAGFIEGNITPIIMRMAGWS
jgi:stage II sporulation protein M